VSRAGRRTPVNESHEDWVRRGFHPEDPARANENIPATGAGLPGDARPTYKIQKNNSAITPSHSSRPKRWRKARWMRSERYRSATRNEKPGCALGRPPTTDVTEQSAQAGPPAPDEEDSATLFFLPKPCRPHVLDQSAGPDGLALKTGVNPARFLRIWPVSGPRPNSTAISGGKIVFHPDEHSRPPAAMDHSDQFAVPTRFEFRLRPAEWRLFPFLAGFSPRPRVPAPHVGARRDRACDRHQTTDGARIRRRISEYSRELNATCRSASDERPWSGPYLSGTVSQDLPAGRRIATRGIWRHDQSGLVPKRSA